MPRPADPATVDAVIDRLEHPDPDWHQQASCRGLDPGLFYPDRGENFQLHDLCDACPVRVDCLADAIATHEHDGWWGGLDDRDRGRVKRAARALRPDLVLYASNGHPNYVRPPAECGTPAGYSRHFVQGTATCRPCREAHNAAKAERKERKRAVA